jgi:hypothetical protein
MTLIVTGARARKRHPSKRAGLTLVELLLAVALFSIMMIAVFQLFDRSMSIWQRGETQRSLLEQASSVGELMGHDLAALEGGARGDVLAEWVGFDTDGDSVRDTFWPRIRLVRQANAAELANRGIVATESGTIGPGGSALIEVVWCVVPASRTDPDARAEGVLWRGEQLRSEEHSSFFDPSFFSRSGDAPTDSVLEASTGLLWLSFQFATQTSIVHDGWTLGDGLEHAVASWDAWGSARPDPEQHPWNEPAPGMPAVANRAVLPRRVLMVLELERPAGRKRRTRTLDEIDAIETWFTVENGLRVPREEGAFIKVGGEWMRVMSVDGETVRVRRGQRGTDARRHDAGELVHHGQRLVREIPVALYREDWNL